MADQPLVLSPLLGSVVENLSCLMKMKEFCVLLGLEKDMKKLYRTLAKIKDVLIDAEQKQFSDIDIRIWLRELRDATYEADDVLDELASEMSKEEEEEGDEDGHNDQDLANKVIQKPAFSKNFPVEIGKKIKDLIEKFDDIVSGRWRFNLEMGKVGNIVAENWRASDYLSIPEPNQVLGRDGDVEDIVTLLLNNTITSDISICPILGMGGLGKTTLANLVYNDERIAKHFEVRSWVCVSDNFRIEGILKSMLASLSGGGGAGDDDDLQRRLQVELCGKRFLLVLDDVWENNKDEWDRLKQSLLCGSTKGNFVIVTTRLDTVASVSGTLPTYPLKALSYEDCWLLFKQRAFNVFRKEDEQALVDIGREIVNNCGGLPLAVLAVGGLLHFKNNVKEWLSVKDSGIRYLRCSSSEDNILSIMSLSYHRLPFYLRSCFAYCSIFPKGHTIIRNELIQLWIANGFVQANGSMDLELVGDAIFNTLLWRSFFQDTEKDEDGRILTCKMHHLVRDLACFFSVDVGKAGNITRSIRHVSLVSSNSKRHSVSVDSIQRSNPGLRSLIMFSDQPSTSKNSQFIFSLLLLTNLRALDLSSTSIDILPDSIGKLKHLRYLNLSVTPIRSLPVSICELRNVQTLYFKRCDKLKSLPRDMGKITSLRHLDIHGCSALTGMPIGLGKLTSLHTLSFFIVGFDSTGCSIKELQGLNLLGGDLAIKQLEHVKHSPESKAANLLGKENLRSLSLLWSQPPDSQENAEEVIEGLQPHSNLRRLHVENYEGITYPSWFRDSSVPNLVEITLSKCTRCEHLPPIGKLPRLKVLKLSSMDSLKFIDDEVYGENDVKGFPFLEELELVSMPRLEGLSPWSQRGETAATEHPPRLPWLKKLFVHDCPKLTEVPLSSSLLSVQLKKANEMVLGSLQNLPCLSSLEIGMFDELECFPQGTLRNLTALQQLKIESCENLNALPTELETFTALTHLKIEGCKKLVSLPNGLGNHPSLKSLSIFFGDDSEDFMDLPDWIGTLTSLHSLTIDGCKNLKVLPKGMQHLNALQELRIVGCHTELERQCEKDKGEDWFKIAHIPDVVITAKRMQISSSGNIVSRAGPTKGRGGQLNF